MLLLQAHQVAHNDIFQVLRSTLRGTSAMISVAMSLRNWPMSWNVITGDLALGK